MTQGESTTDEMMLVYFAFLAYQPGDENILLDSSLLSSALPFVPENQRNKSLSISPNPAQDFVDITFDLPEKTRYRLSIVGAQGQIVQALNEQTALQSGPTQQRLDIASLPPGTYVVEIQTADLAVFTGRFVKQ